MRFFSTLAVLVLARNTVLAAAPRRRSYDTHNYYVVEHDPTINSGASLADVAYALGVEVVEQVGELRDHWLVRSQIPLAALAIRSEGQEEVDPVLATFKDLHHKASSKLVSRSEDGLQAHAIVSSVRHLARQNLEQRYKRAPPPIRPPISSTTVAERFGIKDPMFPQQWHIVNDKFPEHMMNVVPVWGMNITGEGVISSVIDDGLDYTSLDLAQNFVGSLSFYQWK